MQQILRALAICAALAVMPALAADEARAPQVVGACADDDEAPLCLNVLKTIMSDYRKAARGDYQGMRNVAYCQWLGCYGVVAMDLSSACAWRRRIMKHPKADGGDRMNLAMCIERGY